MLIWLMCIKASGYAKYGQPVCLPHQPKAFIEAKLAFNSFGFRFINEQAYFGKGFSRFST